MPAYLHILGQWKETWEPGESPHSYESKTVMSLCSHQFSTNGKKWVILQLCPTVMKVLPPAGGKPLGRCKTSTRPLKHFRYSELLSPGVSGRVSTVMRSKPRELTQEGQEDSQRLSGIHLFSLCFLFVCFVLFLSCVSCLVSLWN